MIISVLIAELELVRQSLGDVPVFFGSAYQDVLVEGVSTVDGYPLIYNRSESPMM